MLILGKKKHFIWIKEQTLSTPEMDSTYMLLSTNHRLNNNNNNYYYQVYGNNL